MILTTKTGVSEEAPKDATHYQDMEQHGFCFFKKKDWVWNMLTVKGWKQCQPLTTQRLYEINRQ